MAPTPLLSKGNGTLARKWRKIKKRCSSFSSSHGESINSVSNGLSRSKSMTEKDALQQDTTDQDREKYNSVGSQDVSRFAHLRGKLNQWNTELKKKRRSSQGDSVSQWWHWNNDRYAYICIDNVL